MKKTILCLTAAMLLLCSCSTIDSSAPKSTADLKVAPTVNNYYGNIDDVATAKAFNAPVAALGMSYSSPEKSDLTGFHYAMDDPITKITLTFNNVMLKAGESRMPIVTMYPKDASNKSEIWTSSDDKIASVDELGNITAVSEGNCVVTVRSAVNQEVSSSVNVTVKSASAKSLTYIDGILIANKTYALPADYNPGVDPKAKVAFEKMQAAAAKEGLNIYISSGFRSYDYQAGLYERYVARSGKAEADRYSARPGHSEHQTGLAFDLNTIEDSFAYTKEYAWVKAHCAEYGFIIRYPENGEKSTGYKFEPWHIRYLGVDTAKRVTASGRTLEEYLRITSKYDK